MAINHVSNGQNECSENIFNLPNPTQDDLIEDEKELIEFMRRHLRYFFMNPIDKFKARKRIPFKFGLVVFKIFIVTIQLVLFGFTLSHHVIFGNNADLVFKHNYLFHWDISHETMPYPPSTGDNALYTQEEFYQSIAYTIMQFNSTPKITTNGYKFINANPPMELCLKSFVEVGEFSNYAELVQNCTTIQPTTLSSSMFDSSSLVESFLSGLNLNIDFTSFIEFSMKFRLLSPLVINSYYFLHQECYEFLIEVTTTNSYQSGKLLNMLTSAYHEVACSNRRDILLRHHLRSGRRVHQFSVFVDLLVILATVLSACLVIRSLVSSTSAYRLSRIFFKNWFNVSLRHVRWHFICPSYLLVFLSDVLTCLGSILKIFIEFKLMRSYRPCSYLLGLGTMLVWMGLLRYTKFSSRTSILWRTFYRAAPAMMRFMACALVLYFAFVLCAWVVIGPYHIKFRTLLSTLDCLFSIINGDDMYVTFAAVEPTATEDVVIFHKIFLYAFIVIFIYLVLNLFLTIILEAYEDVRDNEKYTKIVKTSPLWTFIDACTIPTDSPLFLQDFNRPDRHILLSYAQRKPTRIHQTAEANLSAPESVHGDDDTPLIQPTRI
ncbi:hypothetical protein Ciccas_012728 [Cichlidogyrus casuarinus]|uniref:Polycystin cation channel PKD1/PKD2 domain-containing protein n=1 Tax=Cichlidogyrus casuarinus TaxID=1844966 RepID=A0ABD2PN17_9PLAT